MSNLSKSDFIDWKSNFVTVEVFNIVKQRIEEAKEILADSAGLNPDNDNFTRGMIRAFNELLEIDFAGEDE